MYNGYASRDAFHEALAARFAEYSAVREAKLAADPHGYDHADCDHAYGYCAVSS